MTRANQHDCYEFTMEQEGGYSTDPDDPGNWTGCKPGVGELKGTYKGISACAYPDLDIKNLTNFQVYKIYDRDYWDKVEGDQLPMGVDLCTWDSAVNCGPSKGVEWLQCAMGMPADTIDGAMGPQTLGYVEKIDDEDEIIDSICDQRMEYYRSLSTWPKYGEGWSNRVAAMRDLAHAMAGEEPDIEVEPMVVSIKITMPPGCSVVVDED